MTCWSTKALRRQSRVVRSWRCAHQQPPVAYFPPAKTSTATRITFYQPRLRFCSTEKTNSESTSAQCASYYSSSWWINNQLLASSWWRVIQTKSMQTLIFDPGGFKSRLRACPFFGNVARVALWVGLRLGAGRGCSVCWRVYE